MSGSSAPKKAVVVAGDRRAFLLPQLTTESDNDVLRFTQFDKRALVTIAVVPTLATAADFQAGVAVVDITPPQITG